MPSVVVLLVTYGSIKRALCFDEDVDVYADNGDTNPADRANHDDHDDDDDGHDGDGDDDDSDDDDDSGVNCNPSVRWRLPVSTFLLSGVHIRFKLLPL